MKELAKYFSRSYSVVSQKEDGYAAEKTNWQQQQQKEQLQQQHKSPLSTPKRIIHQMFPVNRQCSSKRISTNTMKKGKKSPKCSFLLMAGGIFAIIAAILVKIMQPYEIIFQYKLKLEEGGEIFNLWEKPPVDLYVKIYLFNITNAEEYLTGKEKMKVEEVGPYVYKEIMEHDDVIFNENNTMSTRPRHPLVWQEEMSEGRSEDDELMMVNIALLSIAQVAADRSYFFRIPINILIRQTNSQPIVKMTAREFMFGYETSLTTLGNTLLPNWISFDKVGLVDRMYDFDADFETFYTGADDVSRSGLYDTYKGSKNLAQWDGEHCSSIHLASDGTKFPSYMEPNDTALFFRKSMCRPQKLVPDGEPTVISGLAAQKFIFEENALDNGYYNQKNKCFCRNGYCQPRGLIDVTDCYYGFPISLSYPHFMDTDPVLLENIEGLKPNYSEHGSYFMVQPRSGLPLECSVKLQINMHMRDVRSMANVERFSHTTIPMLWFEITMPKLPEPLKNRFTLYLNILPYIDIIGFWGGLIIAGVCLLLAFTTSSSTLTLLPTSDSKTKYAKANIRSGIYKPCEVKLIEMNEKTSAQRKKEEEAMMYEIDLSNAKSYILEHEPAISVSDDEGNESDNSSRQSSHYTPSGNNTNNLQAPVSNIRRSSSGYESRNLNGSGNWMMGEASSLIDDIGNDHFPSLKLSSNDLEQYTNEASEV